MYFLTKTVIALDSMRELVEATATTMIGDFEMINNLAFSILSLSFTREGSKLSIDVKAFLHF